MVIHCAAMAPFADTWRNIHTRETHEVPPDIRFYTNAVNRAYVPTREAAAEAITRQALEPIDFPATILQAWEDGVRVFVEHGPRGILTGAVGKILGDRPHLAVALDPPRSDADCVPWPKVSASSGCTDCRSTSMRSRRGSGHCVSNVSRRLRITLANSHSPPTGRISSPRRF